MKLRPYSILVIMVCFMSVAVFFLKKKGTKVTNERAQENRGIALFTR
ncbi:hypothetical protein [Mucilaginibacter pallidiroseus]|nr:hypothetical protein [Mucilaginibacter pallidiroseus]